MWLVSRIEVPASRLVKIVPLGAVISADERIEGDCDPFVDVLEVRYFLPD